jgi:hypothetical protein
MRKAITGSLRAVFDATEWLATEWRLEIVVKKYA